MKRRSEGARIFLFLLARKGPSLKGDEKEQASPTFFSVSRFRMCFGGNYLCGAWRAGAAPPLRAHESIMSGCGARQMEGTALNAPFLSGGGGGGRGKPAVFSNEPTEVATRRNSERTSAKSAFPLLPINA